MDNQKLEKFKEMSRLYISLSREVSDYRNQFFTIMWDGKIVKEAKKVFTLEECKKLKEMEDEHGEARSEYLKALNDLNLD